MDKRIQLKPKLEYKLLCPLVCKYCGRRYPWPFTGYSQHIGRHELKYKSFWSKSSSRPSITSDGALRVISGGIRTGDQQGEKSPATHDSSTEPEETQPHVVTNDPIHDNENDDKTESSVRHTSKPLRRKCTPHRRKLCKYCARRFTDQFWRYQRHICFHERRYRTHWYNLIHGKRSSRQVYPLRDTPRSAAETIKEEEEVVFNEDSLDADCPVIGDLLRQQLLDTECETPDKDLNESNVDGTIELLDTECETSDKDLNGSNVDETIEKDHDLYDQDSEKRDLTKQSLPGDKAKCKPRERTLNQDDHDDGKELEKANTGSIPVDESRSLEVSTDQTIGSTGIHTKETLIDSLQKENTVKQLQDKRSKNTSHDKTEPRRQTPLDTQNITDGIHSSAKQKRITVKKHQRTCQSYTGKDECRTACETNINKTDGSVKHLTVNLVRMQIEPNHWKIMPNELQLKSKSNFSPKSSVYNMRLRDKKTTVTKQDDVSSISDQETLDPIDDSASSPRSSVKQHQMSTMETHYMQDLHFLGRRKRPQAGYYSRLYKGLEKGTHSFPDANKETPKSKSSNEVVDTHKSSQSIRKPTVRNRKSKTSKTNYQNVAEVNREKRADRDGQPKDKGTRDGEDKEQERNEEKEDDDKDGDEDWDNVVNEDEASSSDESYKAEDDEPESDEDSSFDDYDEMNERFPKSGDQSGKIVVRVLSNSDDEDDARVMSKSDDQSGKIVVRVLSNSDDEDDTVESLNELTASNVNKTMTIATDAGEKRHNSSERMTNQKLPDQNKTNASNDIQRKRSTFYQDPTSFRKEMKRLTPTELSEIEKNTEGKKYVNNVPCFKTKRRKYGCKICGKYFAFPQYLKDHITRHTIPKKFVCKVCGKGFQYRSQLRDHTNMHTGKTPYRCRICGKGFKDNRNIKAHERYHTGEKPYKCTYCEKTFRLQCALIGHVRYHTGERPYPCGTCGKAFHTAAHRKRHEDTHTGKSKETPTAPQPPKPKIHPCEYCGKKFGTKKAVRVHHITHTKERPFPCTICGRGFAHQSHRQRHERAVHGGLKPYPCSHCGKMFTTNDNKNTHEKYVHAWDDASSDEKLSSDEDTGDETSKQPTSARPSTRSNSSAKLKTKQSAADRLSANTTTRKGNMPASLGTKDPNFSLHSRKSKRKHRSLGRDQSKDRHHDSYHDKVDHVPISEPPRSKYIHKPSHSPRVEQSQTSRFEKTYASGYDSSRSIFDQFVSKTNVNIVVKHTCGKEQRFTSSSSYHSNGDAEQSAANQTTTAVDHQSQSILSRLVTSSRRKDSHSFDTHEQSEVVDTEASTSISVVESFGSRTTSRHTSESRDLNSALSRLESIQRNAKMIADTLRRNIHGKTIRSKSHHERSSPPEENERMPSLESLLHSLQSASDSCAKTLNSETKYQQHRRHKRTEYPRNTCTRKASSKSRSYDRESSSSDSYTSEEEEKAPQEVQIQPNRRTKHNPNSNKSGMHRDAPMSKQSKTIPKKSWHSDLTPEMKKRLGRQRQKKSFHCQYCSKSFVCKKPLKLHEEEHVKGKRHFCQYCKKGFMTIASVQRHERIHTGEKKFKCKYCPKRFANRYNVAGHERIHTGEKPYSCLTCGMCFVDSGSLTKHDRVHSSEKSYKCDKKGCKLAFKNIGSLKRHDRAIHQGIRYECMYCNVSFVREESLLAHERKLHSGLQPYHCQHCQRRFAKRDKYREHLVSRHKAILSH